MDNKRDGFSLIEVIIAVAILGIVAMSLLSYFSLASNYSSRGRDKQRADMVAQSVIEEINSYNSVDAIEEKLKNATGSAWQIDTLADEVQKESTLTKKMTLDGVDYLAKVKLDYDYVPENEDGDATQAKYNEYATPQLSEVYSPNNIVFSETDEQEVAISNIYHQNTNVSQSTIKSTVERTMCLDFQTDEENAEICHVKAYHEYKYNGKTYTVSLKNEKIEMKQLKNVYLFYQLLRSDVWQESVRIDATALTNEKASEVKIYFIRQKGTNTAPLGYTLQVSGSGNYMQFQYASNNVPIQGITSASQEVIEFQKGNRIAEITVDIYSGEESTFTADNRIVRLQTSKGA